MRRSGGCVGGGWVRGGSPASSSVVASVTARTARSNAASVRGDKVWTPLTLRTYWRAAASISSLVAAAPDGDVPLAGADLSGPTAIVVGSEARGLPPAWLERADVRVRIPMFGRADSLNVSISAAIIVYEAVRQRLTDPATAP